MPTFENDEPEAAQRGPDGTSDFSLDHAIFEATRGKLRENFLVTRIEVETSNPHVKEYRVWVNSTPTS